MFPLSTIKKMKNGSMTCCHLPLEHLLNQSDQSSHLTQTDAVLSFKAHAYPFKARSPDLHVCSRVVTYSNIIIHFNWKANKRDTYGSICSNTVHEAVVSTSVWTISRIECFITFFSIPLRLGLDGQDNFPLRKHQNQTHVFFLASGVINPAVPVQ